MFEVRTSKTSFSVTHAYITGLVLHTGVHVEVYVHSAGSDFESFWDYAIRGEI